MTQVARYERKYFVSGRYDQLMEQWLQQHPAGFSRLYPTRWVWSLYFDTPDWELYMDNVVGSMQRYKVRARWYQSPELTKPQLEHKSKDGFLVKKNTLALSRASLAETPQGLSFHYSSLDAPDLLLHTEPKICNRYQRSYWLSRDGLVRATVDSHLEFMPVTNSWPTTIDRQRSVQMTTANSHQVSSSILELKYQVKDDDTIDRITRHIPFRFTRSSKYVLGVQQLHDLESYVLPIKKPS